MDGPLPAADYRIRCRHGVVMVVAALLLLVPRFAASQATVRIQGDRLSGFVLPVEPVSGDITLKGLAARTWTVDDTKRITLEGDVVVSIAQYTFTGPAAVVWINRLPSAEGLINQIAVYFDEVTDPGRSPGLAAEGSRLLITGSARGGVKLNVAAMRPGPGGGGGGIVRRGEARLAEHLRQLVADPPQLVDHPRIDAIDPTPPHVIVPGGRPEDAAPPLPTTMELPPTTDTSRLPLFRPEGVMYFSGRQIDIIEGEAENAIVASGSFVVEYLDESNRQDWSRLTLSATRGVIFTDPGPIEEMLQGMSRESVHGIYLEGNVVASDGNYTIRGNQVYYDVGHDRAIMLDAVLRTYSRDVSRPVYARAQEMRQIAGNQWTAEKATVSTSAFHTPHLSIGASKVTVTERPSVDGSGGTDTHIEATDNRLRFGDTSILWWPRLAGNVESIPLRGVQTGYQDTDGLQLETRWDLYALIGKDPPQGVDAELKLDLFTKRGAGAGLEVDYARADSAGLIDIYGLLDHGTDRTSAGGDVEHDNDFRGIALWEHRVQLRPGATLDAQLSYISDESYVTTWREDDFENRREYESGFYYRSASENTATTALLKYHFQHFISNSYLLASRQYEVDKVLETTYRRFADRPFSDRLTYNSVYRLSRMRFNFTSRTSRELGVPSRAFGIGPDEKLSDALFAEGLRSDYVNRFDTRHEISMPTQWGIFNLSPFVVGRFTAYSEDFEEFSAEADDMRFFGALGVRINTSFQRVDNSVENRMFDLHRMRHIIEPSMMLWYGYSNVDQGDLPVYDEGVESIATGAAVRLGMRNTWQTQRGGPGRWHSVDFLTVDTAIIFGSGDTDRESPVPQFYEYRPEYSQFGDHLQGTVIWALSDSLSVVGENTYDIDDSRVARGSIGAELRHNPLLTTYAEFRYIDASDDELLDVGWSYRLTPKYHVRLTPQWDFREDDFRSVRVGVTRSFPDFDVIVYVKRDEIKDQTQFSMSLGRLDF